MAKTNWCECVPCGTCNGSGDMWFDFTGRYLENGRCDDLDFMEPCEECNGSGIVDTCQECMDREDDQEGA